MELGFFHTFIVISPITFLSLILCKTKEYPIPTISFAMDYKYTMTKKAKEFLKTPVQVLRVPGG
jgi:hypothetical protein